MNFSPLANPQCVFSSPSIGNVNDDTGMGYSPKHCDNDVGRADSHGAVTHRQSRTFSAGHMTNMVHHAQQYPVSRGNRHTRVGSKLFVGQVPAVATEKQLRPVFEPYGELLEVKIMRDSMGRSKGSAWVRYRTDEMASSAIYALHEKHTVPPQTNPLRVQFATISKARCPNQQVYTMSSRAPMAQIPGETGMVGMPLRLGASVNMFPPTIADNNGGYTLPSSIHSQSVPGTGSGPYTSSTNRVDGLDRNRGSYSSFSVEEQPYTSAPRLYQFESVVYPSATAPHSNVYNQHVHTQQKQSESGSNKKETSTGRTWTFDVADDEHIESLQNDASISRNGGLSLNNGNISWDDEKWQSPTGAMIRLSGSGE